jgi:hypothetical protein
MRAQIKATRLSRRLCVSGLIAFLIGSSFAQTSPQKPDEQRADDIEPDKKAPGPPDQKRQNQKEDTIGGTPDPKDMTVDTLRRMGPYTPRELYPSLMQLPDLSPEKRAEIKRFARQRMEDGLQIFTESRAALTAATEENDLIRMEQAAADMRVGVAQYESGLAAFRALEDGGGPHEIALSWFKPEMNLDSSAETEPDSIAFGMTSFHITLCVLLVLFACSEQLHCSASCPNRPHPRMLNLRRQPSLTQTSRRNMIPQPWRSRPPGVVSCVSPLSTRKRRM